MIRKLILTAMIAAATVAGLSATPATASAQPPVQFHHRFEVFVHHHERGWEFRGSYWTLGEAEHVANHLRREGFRVEVRGN